jgi:hypothetical protein
MANEPSTKIVLEYRPRNALQPNRWLFWRQFAYFESGTIIGTFAVAACIDQLDFVEWLTVSLFFV